MLYIDWGGLFFFGGLCLNRLPWCFLGLKRDCSEGKFNLLEIGASRHYLRARRCLLCKWENRGELSTLCFTFYFNFPSRPLFFASVLKVRLPPPGGKSKNKAWRCYLQIWNSEWITDPLTHWLTVLGDAIASKKTTKLWRKKKLRSGVFSGFVCPLLSECNSTDKVGTALHLRICKHQMFCFLLF